MYGTLYQIIWYQLRPANKWDPTGINYTQYQRVQLVLLMGFNLELLVE